MKICKSIQYVSDIHLELLFKNSIKMINHLLQPKADILVLAGDIGNPYIRDYKDFLENISLKFKKTFIIAGNHEYYGNDIIETKKQINLICNDIENVSFLDNTYEDYHNYRFVGLQLVT